MCCARDRRTRTTPFRLATVASRYRPWARQRVVYRHHFVVDDIVLRFVEGDPLFEDGLIVGVQWNPGVVDDARTTEAARLDLEHVVAAVAILIDPLADRIAHEGRHKLTGPAASIGIDSTKLLHVDEPDVGC